MGLIHGKGGLNFIRLQSLTLTDESVLQSQNFWTFSSCCKIWNRFKSASTYLNKRSKSVKPGKQFRCAVPLHIWPVTDVHREHKQQFWENLRKEHWWNCSNCTAFAFAGGGPSCSELIKRFFFRIIKNKIDFLCNLQDTVWRERENHETSRKLNL